MQAVRTITNQRVGTLYHRPNRTKSSLGNRQTQKSSGSFGSRNAFLKATFKPIYTQQFICDWHETGTNYITQENYEYLRDSYFRYARLLGRVPHHLPVKSAAEGICTLYGQMKELVGEQIGVNLEIEQEKLCFRLWRSHQWGEYTLYWFAVKFIELLNSKLRRLTVTFLHQLMRSNRLDTIDGNDDFEYMLEMFSCDIDMYEEADERKEHRSLLHTYQKGKAYRLLKQVEQKSYYKSLPSALGRYIPQNDFEMVLVKLMQEGLEFIGKDKPSIVSYSYDPYYDELCDFPPMEIEQQIRFIYDQTDRLTEYMTDHFNMNCRESYELVPTTTLDLSPDTEAPFSMDDYPERFFRWADRFIHHTT